MTHTLLAAISALLPIVGFVACGGTSVKPPAAAGETAARSAPASPAAAGQTVASAQATPAVAGAGTVTGSVAETMNSGGYTYVRLQDGKNEVWIAAAEFVVAKGDRLTVPLEAAMQNFHSNTLNRDFPVIYFVSQVTREGRALSSSQGMPVEPTLMRSHEAVASTPVENVAPAPGGLSIADVWAKRASLAGKTVVVRGKVVKFNGGILNRNWVHLQDGSGAAAAGTNDLTVTTNANVKVGDIVTASGVLGISKDFGAGYVYQAILESATVTVK